jgi:hypothetical protein
MPVINTIQVRRDTAANWTSVNPTLAAGEIGLETDTGKFKYGTGSTAWTSLSYAADVSTRVEKTNGTVTTASTSSTVVRNITLSTSDPTGGTDGDVWLKYTE